jgi:hypothetical protein
MDITGERMNERTYKKIAHNFNNSINQSCQDSVVLIKE